MLGSFSRMLAVTVTSWHILLCVVSGAGVAGRDSIEADAEYSLGLLPDCPGSDRNLTISPKLLRKLDFVVYAKHGSRVYRKRYPLTNSTARRIAANANIDFSRRTVFFTTGYYDSGNFPISLTVGEVYSMREYNVILLDPVRLTTYVYPLVARIVRVIGNEVGKVLADLNTYHGMKNKDLELVGLSLGGQIASFAAKKYRELTGQKIHTLVGLDPAGPCFKNRPPHLRYDSSDAEFVQTIKTNIFGFGTPAYSGGVEFYVNGGEFQSAKDFSIPCLIYCSHVRSVLLWLMAVEEPESFIGLRCDSVQQAIQKKCYDRKPMETNLMGHKVDRNKTGIYYLGTTNRYPFYMGRDGLDRNKELERNLMIELNKLDVLNE